MITACGAIDVAVDDAGALTRLVFHTDRSLAGDPAPRHGAGAAITRVRASLEAYFLGDLAAIDSLAVSPRGTEFQRSVWEALRRIPVGETRSYAEIAADVGRPGAVRAVGQANGANPVALVVPCHRVIRSDGSLGGYGFGLDTKRWLLAHEGVWSEPQLAFS